jgi:hypothetical protein
MMRDGQTQAADTIAGSWFYRDAERINGPLPFAELRRLAEHADLDPDTPVSDDEKTWRPARTVPDLKMVWVAYREDGTTYGPFNMLAAPHLVRRNVIHAGTAIRKTVGQAAAARRLARPQTGAPEAVGPPPEAREPDPADAALSALSAPWVDDVDLFQIITQLAEACRRKTATLRDAERERDTELARRVAAERARAEQEGAVKQELAALEAKCREAMDTTRKTHARLETRDNEFKALEQSGRQIQLELERRIEALERRLDESVHTAAELKQRLRAEREALAARRAAETEALQIGIHAGRNPEPDAAGRAASLFGRRRKVRTELDTLRTELEAERRRHEDTWQWSLQKEHAMGKRLAELDYSKRKLEEALAAARHMPEAHGTFQQDAWRIRIAPGTVYGPVPLSELLAWTIQSRVAPEHDVSCGDGPWRKARDVPELGMEWSVTLEDGSSYGPLNILTVQRLMRDRLLAPDAKLSRRHRLDINAPDADTPAS